MRRHTRRLSGYANRYPERRSFRSESSIAWADRMIRKGGLECSPSFRLGMVVAHAYLRLRMPNPIGRYGRPSDHESQEFADFQAGYAKGKELLMQQSST